MLEKNISLLRKTSQSQVVRTFTVGDVYEAIELRSMGTSMVAQSALGNLREAMRLLGLARMPSKTLFDRQP